jgi:hypothetical protein
VTTPAIDVSNVEASVAGATTDGDRPARISMGTRIDPPPIP